MRRISMQQATEDHLQIMSKSLNLSDLRKYKNWEQRSLTDEEMSDHFLRNTAVVIEFESDYEMS